MPASNPLEGRALSTARCCSPFLRPVRVAFPAPRLVLQRTERLAPACRYDHHLRSRGLRGLFVPPVDPQQPPSTPPPLLLLLDGPDEHSRSHLSTDRSAKPKFDSGV